MYRNIQDVRKYDLPFHRAPARRPMYAVPYVVGEGKGEGEGGGEGAADIDVINTTRNK